LLTHRRMSDDGYVREHNDPCGANSATSDPASSLALGDISHRIMLERRVMPDPAFDGG
jgi:hypothetical protein